jgi:hypothetical protein
MSTSRIEKANALANVWQGAKQTLEQVLDSTLKEMGLPKNADVLALEEQDLNKFMSIMDAVESKLAQAA